MNTNENSENKEYKLINLGFEYPGMTGGAKWAVITDLDIHELEEKYREELAIYKPYIVMTSEQGKVIHDFEQNEKKHGMRDARFHDACGYDEGMTEIVHDITSDNGVEEMMIKMSEHEKIRNALNRLPEVQRRRCVLYFYYGMSEPEIARLEGVSRSSIRDSLSAAIKNLKKFF